MKTATRIKKRREGAIALATAVFLIVLLALVAISVDVGYIMLTQTELQAVSDAATLSGGTEILPGLGDDPVAPATVISNGTTQAVSFAGQNRNADENSSYADGGRDVRFGWAVFNSPSWTLNWGAELPGVGGYNLIGTIIRRDQAGSSNADVPVPLFFGRFVGQSIQDMVVDSAAVIMPATGVSIPPGSPVTSNVIPFAIRKGLWDKFLRAQGEYDLNGSALPANPGPEYVRDLIDPDTGQPYTDEPLYGHHKTVNPNHPGDFNNDLSLDFVDIDAMTAAIGAGSTDPDYDLNNDGTVDVLDRDQLALDAFVLDFTDGYDCGCDIKDPTSTPKPPPTGQDGWLEMDIFPRDDYTSGNLGTIDIGNNNNATPDIERQIVDGLDDDDLSYYPDSEFMVPTDANGDTGLSAAIKDELDDVAGDCKVILLFDAVNSPGNTSIFSLVGFASIRVMHSELTGAMTFKHFKVQKCNGTLIGGIGDNTVPPGEDTTVFTPLILVE